MEKYNADRVALGLEHGVLNKDLNKFEFESEEGEKAFQDGGRELLEKIVRIEGETFTIFELGARKITAGDFLSANDLLNLDWLIVEDKAEPVTKAEVKAKTKRGGR